MPSLRSRLINALIRHRHLLRGQLNREVFTLASSIPAFRAQCRESARRLSRPPQGVGVEATSLAGIPAEWLRPHGAPSDKIILYSHGGGYVSGNCAEHRGFVAKFARTLGFAALTYDYRLAPEYPFPAAIDDALAVYRALLECFDARDILLAGESAGGGLTLALLFAIKQHQLPFPSAAIAISPWTDLTCASPAYRTRNARSVSPRDSWTVFSHHYAGPHDRHDPLMSPCFGDPTGFPPLLINAGEDDELFDDGRIFAEKARRANVTVSFQAGAGMIHCYPLLAPMFPEASAAMRDIADFAQRHLSASRSPIAHEPS